MLPCYPENHLNNKQAFVLLTCTNDISEQLNGTTGMFSFVGLWIVNAVKVIDLEYYYLKLSMRKNGSIQRLSRVIKNVGDGKIVDGIQCKSMNLVINYNISKLKL